MAVTADRLKQRVWIPDALYSAFYYQNGCDHRKTHAAIKEALKEGLNPNKVVIKGDEPLSNHKVVRPPDHFFL